MKFFFSLLLLWGLIGSLHAEDQASSLSVGSQWRSVSFVLLKTVRSNADRVFVSVMIKMDPKGLGAVEIALPGKPVPKGATGQEIASGKYDSQPFSLSDAYLLDPRTGDRFQAERILPSGSPFGPVKILARLRPGEALALGVSFIIPISKSGREEQTRNLDLHLPGAPSPIRGVLIPSS